MRAWLARESAGSHVPSDEVRRLIEAATRNGSSERARVEHRMQRLESVGLLAGGIAHDFNNHLTTILGFIDEAIQDLPMDHSACDALDEARRAAQRAADLTRRLLTFGQRAVLRPQRIDLTLLVKEMRTMLLRVFPEDITLAFQLPDAPLWVRVDVGQLETALMNLVINARDATPPGGKVSFAIGVAKDAPTSRPDWDATIEAARISVKDTGSGMDAGTLERIFEPFFTTKAPDKGTGMGLSSVHGFVEQSGGAIDVKSEVGSGSEFSIYLPIAHRVLPEDTPAKLTPAPFRATRPISGRGITILVVEDGDLVREVTRRMLERAGYDVVAVKDGSDALRVLRSSAVTVQLVLTDVVMPVLGGIGLFEALREELPDLRVVFMSGYPNEGEVREFLSSARVPFLPKPFTTGALTRCIEAVLTTPWTLSSTV